jgi:predicted DsbA family dithiol-disulfide isomerase
LLNALTELQNDGLEFKIEFRRLPFFLRGEQKNIDRMLADYGLPPDAPRGVVMEKMGMGDQIWKLFDQAGLDRNDAVNTVQYADTMSSHRLGWYAASISPEKGELMWRALSRRYFQGKDTTIRPIRLDNREMLLECAAEVGLDVSEATRVLDSDAYRAEIQAVVKQMQMAGINSIPVLIFEVEGIAKGNWMQDPRVGAELDSRQLARLAHNPRCRGRMIHFGSGNQEAFGSILKQLHKDCSASL